MRPPLPGGLQVELQAGDAVVYPHLILHWGSSYSPTLRRISAAAPPVVSRVPMWWGSIVAVILLSKLSYKLHFDEHPERPGYGADFTQDVDHRLCSIESMVPSSPCQLTET
jgi:hypothetical protein